MPRYLVEAYLPASLTAIEDAREQARRAGELGERVHYLRTTYVPGDEIVLHVFEAPSTEAVRAASALASLRHERIVEAVEAPTGNER